MGVFERKAFCYFFFATLILALASARSVPAASAAVSFTAAPLVQCPISNPNCNGPAPTAPPSSPAPLPTILVEAGEPFYSDKRIDINPISVGPGQTVAYELFCNSIYCGAGSTVDWDITALGPGLYDANLQFPDTPGDYPDDVYITAQTPVAPQQTYVDVSYGVYDQYGNPTNVSGVVTIAVDILSYQIVVPAPAPTPTSNLNAFINAAVAASRCKVGSGYGPHDGCAIAVNKILDNVLGHTVPKVEGGVAGESSVAGSETCKNFPQASHPCHTEWVPDVVETLVRDGYAQQIVPPNALLQGDIAVQDGNDPVNGQEHIGFCDNNGCSQTISNADSIAQLCGVSNASYSSQGYTWSASEQPTFYRLVRK